MHANDALIFIDANKYLDLYRTDKGRMLLAPLLEEQSSYIFITQQIVDEVQRNKLNVVAEFLRTKNQGVKLQSINVPDHFSGSATGKNQEILSQVKNISEQVSSVNSEINTHTLEIMTQVASSEDEVSNGLAHIFSKAVMATPDEIKRARARKEIGNPPGKRNDPLGDEITWEQVLSHFIGKKRLWIISRDDDYGTAFGGSLFVNSFLKLELARIIDNPIIYLFKDLVSGLKHFIETTQVEAKIKLTAEDVAEIEAEEKSLPPVDSYHRTSHLFESRWSELSQGMAAVQPSVDMQKAIAALAQPSADIQKIIAAMQPAIDIQKAIATAVQPSADVQKIIAALQPAIDMQKAIAAAVQPTTDLQAAIAVMQTSIAVPKDDKD